MTRDTHCVDCLDEGRLIVVRAAPVVHVSSLRKQFEHEVNVPGSTGVVETVVED